MRKFIALIFTVILVFPLLISMQALVSVGSFALDRQFYIDTLDNQQVYETLVMNTLVPSLVFRGLSLPAEADTAQLQSIFLSSLDRDYLRSQIQNFVNSLFDALQGRQDPFAPVIDLSPLKNDLTGEKQQEFLLAIARSMPSCEPGQTPGFGGAEQTACKPQGISDENLVKDYLMPVLPEALAQLPDQVSLVENWEELQSYRNYRSFIPGMAVPASLILSAMIFLMVALSLWYFTAVIADDAWRTRLQWLGWTLLIPSIIIFLIGAASASGIPVYWINYGLDRTTFSGIPLLGQGLAEILRAIIQGAIPRVSAAFLMVGGISAALALGLIFWGLLTSKPTRTEV